MKSKDSRLDPSVERRASKRFPIEQEVSYKVLDHRAMTPETGVGMTVDISSKGVLFGAAQPLRAGKRIEICVNWPALLEGACPLKLVAVGRVVRVEANRAAVQIEQHEFRTRRIGRSPAEIDAPRKGSARLWG